MVFLDLLRASQSSDAPLAIQFRHCSQKSLVQALSSLQTRFTSEMEVLKKNSIKSECK